jgi:hypothetical protein
MAEEEDEKIFDVHKFDEGVELVDPGTDAYANLDQMYISFLHVPSGKTVYFKAFITAFNEAFSSDWVSESVYGRADPIYLFKSTTRKITLAFKIPAYSQSEAFENIGRVQKLTQFLYPNYTTLNDDVFAQTISQSPLIRLKVMNLLATQLSGEEAGKTGRTYKDLIATTPKKAFPGGAETGLLGVIDSVTVNHNLEIEGGFNEGPGLILPKLLEVNLGFSPIHEHALGWDEKNNFSNVLFPYGLDTPPFPEPPEGAGEGTPEDTEDSADATLEATTEGSNETNVEPVPEPTPGADAGMSDDVADQLNALPGF